MSEGLRSTPPIVKRRAFALQALLQGDGITPEQFDEAVASVGSLAPPGLNLPLQFRYGFIYLRVQETGEQSIAALERELARLR